MDRLGTSYWSDWGDLFTLVAAVAVVALAIVLGFRAYRASLDTRGATTAEARSAKLAEEMAEAIRAGTEDARRNAAALGDVQRRLTAIEGLLRQVE